MMLLQLQKSLGVSLSKPQATAPQLGLPAADAAHAPPFAVCSSYAVLCSHGFNDTAIFAQVTASCSHGSISEAMILHI